MNINTFKVWPGIFHFLVFTIFVSYPAITWGVVKTSNGNGSWSTSGLWSPSGVPAAGDVVTIRSGDSISVNNNYTVSSLTINSGGSVYLVSNKVLTINGALTVNGRMTMNGGDIIFSTTGAAFNIGADGYFSWEPKTNTLAYASLFIKGVENFASTSTLIIKKWYSYTVALGSVVTGNFGNLTLNSMNGSYLTEWNQNNQFQTHQVLGTLTVNQGWIVLDKSGSISTTTIGNISLLKANSSLDLHGGTHGGSFTVNTWNMTIVAGMLTRPRSYFRTQNGGRLAALRSPILPRFLCRAFPIRLLWSNINRLQRFIEKVS